MERWGEKQEGEEKGKEMETGDTGMKKERGRRRWRDGDR